MGVFVGAFVGVLVGIGVLVGVLVGIGVFVGRGILSCIIISNVLQSIKLSLNVAVADIEVIFVSVLDAVIVQCLSYLVPALGV
jgi:hypothetical protein